MIDLRKGDCLETLKTMEDNSVDLILTDPPYHLMSTTSKNGVAKKGFMGKEWDGANEEGVCIAFSPDLWKQALRVLKPGGYLMAFSSTRTYHKMTSSIEDAGFNIRDMISYNFGSGFPKALDISKSLLKKDKEDIAKQYEGYKSCLKPAHEPICLAQKEITEKNYAENVIKWGTGGLNIDVTRIGDLGIRQRHGGGSSEIFKERGNDKEYSGGRYPANFIISEDIAEVLDKQSGIGKSNKTEGGASRFFYNTKIEEGDYIPFFYTSKASKRERNSNTNGEQIAENKHNTVKPISIMEYLAKLGLPPYNSVVLDLFAGSGTTGMAIEKINRETGSNHTCILCEMEDDYIEIIKKRLCLD